MQNQNLSAGSGPGDGFKIGGHGVVAAVNSCQENSLALDNDMG